MSFIEITSSEAEKVIKHSKLKRPESTQNANVSGSGTAAAQPAQTDTSPQDAPASTQTTTAANPNQPALPPK